MFFFSVHGFPGARGSEERIFLRRKSAAFIEAAKASDGETFGRRFLALLIECCQARRAVERAQRLLG